MGTTNRELKRAAARRRQALLAGARERGTHTEDEWLLVLDEFGYRCVKCGCAPIGRPTKDHILPINAGGSDAIDNLQPLCRECNSSKRFHAENWVAYRRAHGFEREAA